MRFLHPRRARLGATLLVVLAAAACESGTEPQLKGTATVTISSDRSPAVAALSLQISGPGMDTARYYFGPDTGETVSGTVLVPAGARRHIAALAFDSDGVNTYKGDTTLTLVAGSNPPLHLLMRVLSANDSIVVTVGDFWAPAAPMPIARGSLGVGVVNGILYVVDGGNDCCGAGLTTVEAYDAATNTWTTKAPDLQQRNQLAVGVIGGTLYAVGGWHSPNQLSTLTAYDPLTDSWTAKASMPTPRRALAAGVVGDTLYAVGGYDPYVVGALSTVEAYDPVSDSWATRAPLPTARSGLAVAVVNGILYAIGGVDNDNNFLGTVEAYDPATNTWSTKSPMPTPRFSMTAAVVNGIIYVMGGSTGVANTFVTTVEAYDPSTDTWTTRAAMPAARAGAGAGAVSGIIYQVGGANTALTAVDSVESYQP